jgi:hypothetical protein
MIFESNLSSLSPSIPSVNNEINLSSTGELNLILDSKQRSRLRDHHQHETNENFITILAKVEKF